MVDSDDVECELKIMVPGLVDVYFSEEQWPIHMWLEWQREPTYIISSVLQLRSLLLSHSHSMSQVTVIQCNLSNMDRLNVGTCFALSRAIHCCLMFLIPAIEDFTRNLGPTTLSFCSSVNQ